MSVFDEFMQSCWKLGSDYEIMLENIIPKINFMVLFFSFASFLFFITVIVLVLSVNFRKKGNWGLITLYAISSIILFILCAYESVNIGIIFANVKLASMACILYFSLLIVLYVSFSAILELFSDNCVKTETAISNGLIVNRVIASPIKETATQKAFRVQNISMSWFVQKIKPSEYSIDYEYILKQIRLIKKKELNEAEIINLSEIEEKINRFRLNLCDTNMCNFSDILMYLVKLKTKYKL